jgi:hypothetical protein
MKLSPDPLSMKLLLRAQPKFQQTFWTPGPQGAKLAKTIVSAGGLEAAQLGIRLALGDSPNIKILLEQHSLRPANVNRLAIQADGPEEVEALLRATFTDSTDFLFIPQPKPFVVYADHDEYTTFYSHTRSNLNLVVHAVAREGFKTVEGFARTHY